MPLASEDKNADISDIGVRLAECTTLQLRRPWPAIRRIQNFRRHELFQLMQPIVVHLITKFTLTKQVNSLAKALSPPVQFVLPSH
jgi:hypothetical protein